MQLAGTMPCVDKQAPAGALLVTVLCREAARRIKQASDARLKRMRACTASMASAATFSEWTEAASELEGLRAADLRRKSAQFRRQVCWVRKLLCR